MFVCTVEQDLLDFLMLELDVQRETGLVEEDNLAIAALLAIVPAECLPVLSHDVTFQIGHGCTFVRAAKAPETEALTEIPSTRNMPPKFETNYLNRG